MECNTRDHNHNIWIGRQSLHRVHNEREEHTDLPNLKQLHDLDVTIWLNKSTW